MSSVTAWRRPLALGLWISTALMGPAVAGEARLLAQAKVDCADAKSHFEIAKEIGTREALQVHIDNYGDCPFAPFAEMLMDKLPAAAAGDTPSPILAPVPKVAVEVPPAAPAVDAKARRLADAFVAFLNETPKAMGEPDGFVFSYESAETVGADTRIVGLQYRTPQTTYREQTRLRFATTLLVKPTLAADGTLSAERIEAAGLESSERNPGEEAFAPFRNSDGFQAFAERVAVDKPAILAKGAGAGDAIGQRFRMKGLELKGLKLVQNGKPFASLDSLTAETDRIEKGLPYKLGAKADGLSLSRDMLERNGDAEANKAMAALGFGEYVFGVQIDVEADSDKRTISLNRLSTSMKGGFGSSIIVRLSDIDLADGLSDLMAGGRTNGVLKTMNIDFATVAYIDSGLFPKLLDFAAAASGVDANLLKSFAPAQAQAAAFGFLADQTMADDIRDATTEFLATPQSLGATLAPQAPVNIWSLASTRFRSADDVKAALIALRASVQVNQRPEIRVFRPLLLASLPPEAREAITTCHRLAADSDDPMKTAPGIKSPNDIDFATALPACEAAQKADPSDPLLAFELGRTYYAAGNPTLANSFYNLAAVGGHDVAKYELASAELYGSGMPADPQKAIKNFESIADRLPVARSMLASIYSNGTGVPADPQKAIAIWQAGADKGEAESQYSLGIEYILGTNIAADPLKGRDYLQKAADQDHPDAMAELGKSFFRGDGGTTPDYPTAYRWAEKAADAGSTIGQANAGYMLAAGLGASEKDPKKAARLLLTALSKGDTDAEAYLITDKAKDLDKDFRKAVQVQMKKDGTYNGPTTGLFGRQTMDALQAIRDAGQS